MTFTRTCALSKPSVKKSNKFHNITRKTSSWIIHGLDAHFVFLSNSEIIHTSACDLCSEN